MADIVDIANDEMERQLELRLEAARGDIPAGKPGDCDLCGEWFGRLVNGACVSCRERYKLP
jgi:hypothetical protein